MLESLKQHELRANQVQHNYKQELKQLKRASSQGREAADYQEEEAD